jgi:hypothetical protein
MRPVVHAILETKQKHHTTFIFDDIAPLQPSEIIIDVVMIFLKRAHNDENKKTNRVKTLHSHQLLLTQLCELARKNVCVRDRPTTYLGLLEDPRLFFTCVSLLLYRPYYCYYSIQILLLFNTILYFRSICSWVEKWTLWGSRRCRYPSRVSSSFVPFFAMARRYVVLSLHSVAAVYVAGASTALACR